MELYFAELGLSSGGSIGVSEIEVRTEDAFHWLENRGFQITRKDVTFFGSYDKIEGSLARYGVLPCSDIVADISLKKQEGIMRLVLDLASNGEDILNDCLGISCPEPRLSILQYIYPVQKEEVEGDFERLKYGNREIKVFSVAQLKDFLRMK